MKRIIFLWAALAAVLLCACGGKPAAPQPAEPRPEPEAPQVTALICSDGEMTLRFHRGEDGTWLWTDDTSFPLDGAQVDELADRAQALESLTPLPESEGPETYGLLNARQYVTLQRSDGTTTTFRFGRDAGDGKCYVCSDQEPQRICIGSRELLEQMGRSIYDMAALPQLPAFTADTLRQVTVTRGDRTDKLTVSGGKWRLGGDDVTGSDAVQQLLALLASPAVTRCVDFAPSPGAAALCGLEPPAAVLTVTGTGDAALTLTVGSATEDGTACFVTVNDDTTIYLMDAAALDVLRTWNE